MRVTAWHRGCRYYRLSRCADPPLEDVTIVHAGEDEETGSPDQYTIVEFPDGSRRMRYRHLDRLATRFGR